MSDQPPVEPPQPSKADPYVVPPGMAGGRTRVEDLTLRLLRDMRAEHAASLEAMRTELAATRRIYANMERMFDRLDTMQAELTAFRTETEKNFRRLETDIITAEGQNISRQQEILDAVRRIGELEIVIPAAE